jgi:hypothetical protein
MVEDFCSGNLEKAGFEAEEMIGHFERWVIEKNKQADKTKLRAIPLDPKTLQNREEKVLSIIRKFCVANGSRSTLNSTNSAINVSINMSVFESGIQVTLCEF